MRTSEGNDALAWISRQGESVIQSHLAILHAAACSLNTPAIERPPEQHELVRRAVERIMAEETRSVGGQLGAASGARYKTYTRLKAYIDATSHTLILPPPELQSTLADIYLSAQEIARETLNRQLRSGITGKQLAAFVMSLHAEQSPLPGPEAAGARGAAYSLLTGPVRARRRWIAQTSPEAAGT
jgi:hypothetical protein